MASGMLESLNHLILVPFQLLGCLTVLGTYQGSAAFPRLYPAFVSSSPSLLTLPSCHLAFHCPTCKASSGSLPS